MIIQIIVYWIFYGYLSSEITSYSIPFFSVIAILMAISDSLFTITMFSIYPLFMFDFEINSICNCLFWHGIGIGLGVLIHMIGFGDPQSRMIGYLLCLFLCSIPFFISSFAKKMSKSKWDIIRQQNENNQHMHNLNQPTTSSPTYSH